MEKLTPKAIIFDLGSTLIEYEVVPWPELAVECINNVGSYLRRKGYDIPDKGEFYNIFEESKAPFRDKALKHLIEWTVPEVAEAVIERLGINDGDDLADKMFDVYYRAVDEKLYAYDDTAEILGLVKERIGTVGLISNTVFPDTTHLKELKRFDLDSYFDFTIFSSTFGLRKPHSDIFIQAANQAGFAPSECVYVGDRYIEDVTGPNSIGMHAILKKLPQREYPVMPEDTRIISCLSDLKDHILLDNTDERSIDDNETTKTSEEPTN